MDKHRFLAIIEAYGADSRRWPIGERVDVEAFARAHPDAAAPALADARGLDDALMKAVEAPPPSAALRQRILAAVPGAASANAHGGRRFGRWLDFRGFAAASALALCVLSGAAAGYAYGEGETARQADEALFVAAFDVADPSADFEEG